MANHFIFRKFVSVDPGNRCGLLFYNKSSSTHRVFVPGNKLNMDGDVAYEYYVSDHNGRVLGDKIGMTHRDPTTMHIFEVDSIYGNRLALQDFIDHLLDLGAHHARSKS